MSLWTPLDSKSIADPYPMYKKLREVAPVFKAQTGEWIVTTYDDVLTMLKDKRFLSGSKKDWVEKGVNYFNSKSQDFSLVAQAIDTFLLFLNPPHHTKVRRLVTKAWDNRLVDQIINENLNHLLHGKPKSSFDIITDLAQPLPAMTIAKIMGIPMGDYETLRAEGTKLLKVLDLYISLKDFISVNDSAKFFVEYFLSHIHHKRTHLSDDLISKIIIQNKKNEEYLSSQELASLCIFLFLAGEETTVSLVGNGLLNLAEHPSQRKKLIQEPLLIDQALEELLRFDSPVHVVGRIASENINYKNQKITKGEIVTLCLASANRDEKHFPDADHLLLERSPNRHVAFGSGMHFCLGDWLAKRQGSLAIAAFLKKYPKYQIDHRSLTLNNNLSIRSYLSMKVESPIC